ncbi:hypothetical protein COO60DRAFT_1515953 [Scenedesmus sp. NREL 46B-D3]|nr:hypothetical protein COO60DRAFT_1515953 [Scenedesmus sp. NREL 46B-D3]
MLLAANSCRPPATASRMPPSSTSLLSDTSAGASGCGRAAMLLERNGSAELSCSSTSGASVDALACGGTAATNVVTAMLAAKVAAMAFLLPLELLFGALPWLDVLLLLLTLLCAAAAAGLHAVVC